MGFIPCGICTSNSEGLLVAQDVLRQEKKKEKKTDPEDFPTERNVNVWGLGS